MRKRESRRSDHPSSSELVRAGKRRLGQETTRAGTDAAGRLVDALGLSAMAGEKLADARIGKNGWRATGGSPDTTTSTTPNAAFVVCEFLKGFDLRMNCHDD